MRKCSRHFLGIIFIFLVSISTLMSIDIKGRVVDKKSGTGVSRLKVILMGSKRSYINYTDEEGFFNYKGLPSYDYSLNIYFKEKLVYSRRISSHRKNFYLVAKVDTEKLWERGKGSAELSGKVIDGQSLLPVRGAYVFLDGGDKFTLTDKNGNYFFSDINQGEHILKVKMRGYKEVEKIIKITSEEAYCDFELLRASYKKKNGEVGVGNFISQNMEKDEERESEYLTETMADKVFEAAIKKVSTQKLAEEEKNKKSIKEQLDRLPTYGSRGLSLLGGTGLVDVFDSATVRPGKMDLGMGVYTGTIRDQLDSVDTTLSSYKVVYGLNERAEIGFTSLQRSFSSSLSDSNSQFLNLKYKLGKRGPLQLAIGYSYVNDERVQNSNLLNFIGEYRYQTGKYLYNLIFNLVAATDLSNSMDMFLNVGLETSLKGSKYPVSYIVEMSQDENREFNIFNIGVRLKRNPSFDFVFKKNVDKKDKMLGLGTSLSF